MEGTAVNMPRKRRHKSKVTIQMAKVTIARKKTFPRTSNPQRTSSEQAIDSVPPIPKESYQTSQVDSVMIDVDEPSSREHRANETQTDERDCEIRDLLYIAVQKGDWQSAKKIHEECPDADIWNLPITRHNMNALQVAVAAKHTHFVNELLNCMTAKQLEFQNVNGDTALAITVLSGNMKIAMKMVQKNEILPMIRNHQFIYPLLLAAMYRQRDMVLYLYLVTNFEELTPNDRLSLLFKVILCDMYDIAMDILRQDSTLGVGEYGHMALKELARKPFAIGSRSHMSAWERCIGYCFKGVYNKALMRTSAHQLVEVIWKKVQKFPLKQRIRYYSTIFTATKLGNVEFLTILLRCDPYLIWFDDENRHNIFHMSIQYRQEGIFNLIYEINIFKEMIGSLCDKDQNNMLHLVGKLAPVNILSGAALHMQRELLWFKEIEKIVPLEYLRAKNLKGKTPNDLFTETHKDLHKEGEKWMKDTAKHCMVVATLIATVVFAAAFTVPGGNDQVNGTPILLERNWFMIFFISDSIAMLSASTSIVTFLSILTSSYTVNDFLSSLPRKLMIGLTTLFISIVGMVVAFGATCFLVCQRKMTRVPTVIIALAGVPICFFLLLHHKLLVDVIRSAYFSRYLFGSRKRLLF